MLIVALLGVAVSNAMDTSRVTQDSLAGRAKCLAERLPTTDRVALLVENVSYDPGAYELIAALHEAITDPECKKRFIRKERAFYQATCDRESPLTE